MRATACSTCARTERLSKTVGKVLPDLVSWKWEERGDPVRSLLGVEQDLPEIA